MPFRSNAQRKAMYAAAAGDSTVGIPQDAAERFVAHSDASVGGLPEHVPTAQKRSKKRKLKAKRKSPKKGY